MITSPVSGSTTSRAATRPTTSEASMSSRSIFASRSFLTAALVNLVPFLTSGSAELPTLMSAVARWPERAGHRRHVVAVVRRAAQVGVEFLDSVCGGV
jgi:hypothetical protein